jgi:hypothetical protein
MLDGATAQSLVQAIGGTFQLPADFSSELDVLVLAGAGYAPWLHELSRRGIERVLVFAPGESAPAAGRVAGNMPDVIAKLLDFEPAARRITLQRLPNSGLSDHEFQELSKSIQNGGMNRATFATSGPTWVKHALANLPLLGASPSIDCLKGSFAGKPCVLVSPGPSLAKNIDALRAVADRVLIIAGNRAVAPLRRAGIVPDIAVVADAIDLSYQLGGGLLDDVPALLLDVITHPAVTAIPVERRFFFSAIQELCQSTFRGLGQNGALGSGGSVATVALTVALHLGCDPIAMIGQDLALSGEQYYIDSAPDGDTRIKLESSGVGTFENSSPELRRAMNDAGGTKLGERSVQQCVKVPGYAGGEVFTSLQFDTYRRWLGSAAKQHQHEVRIYNCTEGGARIDNMQQLPLAELAARLPTQTLDKAGVLAACHERDPRKPREQALERHIRALQQAIHETNEEVQRCERVSHQVERAPAQMDRLDKAERKLNDAVRKLPFVVALASIEVERARRAGANAKSLEEALSATRSLYAVIKQAVALTRPALAEALQRLKRAACAKRFCPTGARAWTTPTFEPSSTC